MWSGWECQEGHAKKKKPLKTFRSSEAYLVGRGNLNQTRILLIFIINIGFNFYMEYQMECLAKLHSHITALMDSRLTIYRIKPDKRSS